MKRRLLAMMMGMFMLWAACALGTAESTAAEEVMKAPKYKSVSVHDPSVIRAEDGTFYIFGSHMAAAKSEDLMNWTLISKDAQAGCTLVENVQAQMKEALSWAKTNTFWAPVRAAAGKLGGVPIVRQVGWCFAMMRNPFDCSYGIKKEKRSSLWAAAIIVVLFFILQAANKYFSGFLFKTVREGEYELLRDAALTFGAFLLLTVCCYLVCTIKDGEARFTDIVIGGAAALTPLLIALPIRLLLSNVITFNEEFFLTLLDVVAYGFTGVLIVLAIMYLNDYTFKKTLAILVITLFTVLVTVALLFVVYVLIGQLIDFISSIYGEVVYRFVRKV